MHIRNLNRNNKRGERGSVLAMSAISMLALLLATGLAVDISHFYTAKAELQNAADAAALAAVSALNTASLGITKAADRKAKASPREVRYIDAWFNFFQSPGEERSIIATMERNGFMSCPAR